MTITETLAQGQQHEQAGHLDQAEQAYRAVLQADPSNVDALHRLGLVVFHTGRGALAVEYLRQVLGLNPDVAQVHNNLGNILTTQRKLDEAIASYQCAIRLAPGDAGAHVNLGNALRQVGRLTEAEASCRTAIRLRPDFAEAHNNLGNVLKELQRPEEAAACYREAIRLKPGYSISHNNLGNTLHELGKSEEATACYREAIRLKPDYAEGFNNYAVVLQALGKPEEAAACCREAIRLQPNYADARVNLAWAYQTLGRPTDAVAECREAIRLQPRSAEAHNNLGNAFKELGKPVEAAAAYREAVRLKPTFAEAYNNLGSTMHDLEKPEEAAAAYREAIRLRPTFAEAHNNLGSVLHPQGHRAEAMALYEQAIKLKPDFADSHLYRAMTWLQEGDFERGWPEYEWRRRCKQFFPPPLNCPQPYWDGSPLHGRTVLVRTEQGLGDAIEFIRYAALVKARGGRVVVESPAGLVPLFKRCPGIDHVFARGEPLPPFDVHVLLLSVPGLVGTTVATIPADVPYLFADPALVEHWRRELSPYTGLKVGFVWQGKIKYVPDRLRAVPLERFIALSRLPGVHFFSLHKGTGLEQLGTAQGSGAIVDLGSRLDEAAGPFMDTAAVMKNMDLVISSDTAIAHLAGALGVPVWIAVPVNPHWPWLLDRDDTPWYPTMRLFRQRDYRNWDDVFERIAAELAKMIAQRAPSPGIADPLQSAAPHFNRGFALHKEGKLKEAMACYRQALACHPGYAEAQHNLAGALQAQGHHEEAAAGYRQAIRLKPDYGDAYFNLGQTLKEMGKMADAEDCFREAIRLRPDLPDAHFGLGYVLTELSRPAEAVPCHREAIRLRPTFVEAHNSLAVALQTLGHGEEAMPAYREAIRLDPDLAVAHYNLGQALLQAGDFEAGWREYEWRWHCESFAQQILQTAQPRWDGSTLKNGTIFIYTEQGLGDALQFIRFMPLVKERCSRLIVGCHVPLTRLFESCAGIDKLVPNGTGVPRFDVHAPLMSVPGLLGTTLTTIPSTIPYISADPQLVREWGRELAATPGFKVGIAWKGSPTYRFDHHRSIPLENFTALARVKGVQFYSLQKQHGLEQLPAVAARMPLIDLGDRLDVAAGPFMDTAAVVKNLDLVITADTALAHLAGALGVPVWLALTVPSHWVWLRRREDSPWYPTMRLFRQKELDNWGEVFERMTAELYKAVAHGNPGANGSVEPRKASAAERAPPPQSGAAHEAHFAEAVALHHAGKLKESMICYRRALACKPDYADAHNNLAAALQAQGHLEEAVAGYREVLRLKPGDAMALCNLGRALRDSGNLLEAGACIREGIRLRPEVAEAHNSLALVFMKETRYEEAAQSYREAIRLKPAFVEAHNNLAGALLALGQTVEAAAECQEAVRLNPNLPEPHHLLGNALKTLGRSQEAVACHREAIRLKPTYADAHNRLGEAFKELGMIDEAAACYREALRLDPNSTDAYFNLGFACNTLGKPQEAAKCYREVIRHRPDYFEAHNNLAFALQAQGQPVEAAASYREAIRLQPDLPEAHYNLGQAYLQAGDFERGWPEYEWRWRCKTFLKQLLQTSKPLWDGSPLNGRTIYLYAEQGLGDTVWFIRYVPMVKARGGRTIVACHPALLRLLRNCPGIDQLVPENSELPEFDVQAPFMSLPGIFGTTLATIPTPIPYLAADPELVQKWRADLSAYPSFKVGIAWQGSPTYGNDRNRSIPLEHFTALAGVKGVQFFSLQKQHGLDQLPGVAGRLPLIDLNSRLDIASGPFMDTAAVIMNLDLVITAETSVAQLAGAMGTPVWIALSYVPYWPWMLHREDSPWYPTARLFRQKEQGNWTEVFQRIALELSKLVAQRGLITHSPAALPATGAPGQDSPVVNQRPTQPHPPAPPPIPAHEALFRQGLTLHHAGNIEEAKALYQRALALQPDYAEAHNNLAAARQTQGRLEEAVAGFREAVRLKPEYAEAHYNLGFALRGLGKLEEAASCYREAVRLRPAFAAAHCNLGMILKDLDRPQEAAACHREAIRLMPDYAEAHNNLAVALQAQGKLSEAAAGYREAIRLDPDFAGAYNNLGNVLRELGKPEESAACCREALRLDPDLTDVHNNLGNALQDLGKLDEAATCFHDAIRLKPNDPEGHNNLGVLLQTRGNTEDAIASYREAIRLKPTHADAHHNLGQAYLQLGDYPRGWPEYEWRCRRKGYSDPPMPPSKPVWDGTPLIGRAIFLHVEQGLGDTLQFIRFASVLKQRGARVIVGCQQALVALLHGCADIDHLVAPGTLVPPIDVHARLMSVPGLLGATLATIPATVPYLTADPAVVDKWRRDLPARPAFKVGIAWQGNPDHKLDRWRSVRLAQLAPLARVKGIEFFSLQKGKGQEQLQLLADRFKIVDLSSKLTDFVDTAAVMKNLDLVITVDSSLAHLAGGLGVPVWVALPIASDWRWLLRRDDSPWYPTMRLFRQQEFGKWDTVFERMALELARKT